MFPLWPIVIYALTYQGTIISSDGIPSSKKTSRINNVWKADLSSHKPKHAAILNTALYLVSVVITLIFTEIGKASFATTRPKPPTDSKEWRRRYGKLVASLKSKHSFPSGDSAQAMNLCMFVWRYVPVDYFGYVILKTLIGNAGIPIDIVMAYLLFGIFLPGVAFARVFYRCHWIEDCMGGIALSWILHWVVLPAISKKITQLDLFPLV